MSEDSPFEQWRLATIPQVAVSRDILELLALAFEGGRQYRQPTTAPREIPESWATHGGLWIEALYKHQRGDNGETS